MSVASRQPAWQVASARNCNRSYCRIISARSENHPSQGFSQADTGQGGESICLRFVCYLLWIFSTPPSRCAWTCSTGPSFAKPKYSRLRSGALPGVVQSLWGLGVLAVWLHALVDFPMQTPALALWVFVLLGGACAQRVPPNKLPWA